MWDWQMVVVWAFVFGMLGWVTWDAVAPLIRGGDDG